MKYSRCAVCRPRICGWDGRLSPQRGAAPLHVLRNDPQAEVPAPYVVGKVFPITDCSTAPGSAAKTAHGEIILIQRGGIVEEDLLTGPDIADGVQVRRVPGNAHPRVRVAGVVDVVIKASGRADVQVRPDLERIRRRRGLRVAQERPAEPDNQG